MEIRTGYGIYLDYHEAKEGKSKKWVAVDDLIKEIDTMRDVPLYCKSYEWQDILQELKDKLSQSNPPSESAAHKE